MNARAITRLAETEKGRQWVYGAGVMLAATLLVVAPMATRLVQTVRGLRRIRTTYTQKLSLADRKDEFERRVREQEAAVAELDARLLSSAEIGRLTKAIGTAARRAGCSVLSTTRPPAPQVLPRPATEKGKASEARAECVQWRVSVEVRGEYRHISELLGRLRQEPWHLQVRRLTLEPDGDDRETLRCQLELAGYGLRPAASGEQTRTSAKESPS